MRLLIALVLLAAVVVVGCSDAPLPSSASAIVELSGEGVVGQPVLRLTSDVGGGCNVAGPYPLSTRSEVLSDRLVVTITGHDYRTDGGECTEVASAVGSVDLPSMEPGESYELEIVLDEVHNLFSVSRSGSQLTVQQDGSGNVTLACRVPDQNRSTGCVVMPPR